jgi:hypothetical protein
MSRKHLVAGRLATYLLAAAALPMVACMDAPATGTTEDGLDTVTITNVNEATDVDGKLPIGDPVGTPAPRQIGARDAYAGDRVISADSRGDASNEASDHGKMGIAAGTQQVTLDDRNVRETGPTPPSLTPQKLDPFHEQRVHDLPSSVDRGISNISEQGFPKQIVSAEVSCVGKTATVQVQVVGAPDELEVRMAPQYKVGEYGRWYEVRESFLLHALTPAPGSKTSPYWAQIAIEGPCEDWKAQVEEIRATFARQIETFNLAPASK